MSSTFTVIRKCQQCGSEFNARTTVTKYCSSICSGRAAKSRIRNLKIEKSNSETQEAFLDEQKSLLLKEVLTVKDVSKALSISVKAVYRLIDSGKLKAANISTRMTRVLRSEVLRLLEPSEKSNKVVLEDFKKEKEIKRGKLGEIVLTANNCYSIPECCEKFEMDRALLYTVLKRHGVSKIKIKKEIYLSKVEIEKLLFERTKPKQLGLEKVRQANSKMATNLQLKDCYSIEEVELLFKKKRELLYSFFRRRAVPTIKVGNYVYLSKKVVNKIYRKEFLAPA